MFLHGHPYSCMTPAWCYFSDPKFDLTGWGHGSLGDLFIQVGDTHPSIKDMQRCDQPCDRRSLLHVGDLTSYPLVEVVNPMILMKKFGVVSHYGDYPLSHVLHSSILLWSSVTNPFFTAMSLLWMVIEMDLCLLNPFQWFFIYHSPFVSPSHNWMCTHWRTTDVLRVIAGAWALAEGQRPWLVNGQWLQQWWSSQSVVAGSWWFLPLDNGNG